MTITVVSSVLSGQDKDVFPFIETTSSWSIAIHNIQVGDYVLVCYACDNPATESSFSSSFVSTSGGIQYLTYIGYEEVTNSGNVSTGIAIFKIAALPPSGDSLSLRIYGPGGAKAMTCYDVKGLVSTDVEDIAITTETGTNPPYNTGSTVCQEMLHFSVLYDLSLR